ncbi:glycerol kinase GlpK [Oceanisphaera pacifica]|uniref:Glycerol kinase n=1 Tax=Oceanisphaera pacifica TaxID=2818389 RepID=A0ABS3NFZ3_9GAMM|nr:glycerol kinase GlpK [Oceanisphaera pacifica]MBO1519508.1 glycerol kinase GlpK [Oceanisphaera pacifica]
MPSSPQYVIALDQGTTSSRAIIFDDRAQIQGCAQREFAQIYPQTGWVEHDAMEIWASQRATLTEVLAKTGMSPTDISAIGITNQRETTVIWNKHTGRPIYNAIVWQCRRTAEICEQLTADGLSDYVQEQTGLVIDAYFSGTKIKWLLDNVEGAREQAERGELLFGTIDTWLIWKLTEGRVHATDYTNASRTMLFNINTLTWDDKLLKALAIPRSLLPEVKASGEIFGYAYLGGSGIGLADKEISNNGGKVAIAGVAGDQQAALFGQLCVNKGMAKNTYGTGCFLLMNTGLQKVRSQFGLLTTLAIGAQGEVNYALEGSVFMGGAIIQWLRDELGLIRSAEDTEYFAGKVSHTNGVYLVPAFVGLGAPYWDPYARGTLMGLSRGANRNHIIRAALEAIAYQSQDVLHAMQQDAGIALSALKVDGGAVANDILMQFQADISDIDVVRPTLLETTALGAAFLAGLAVGIWQNTEQLSQMLIQGQRFTPAMRQSQRETLYQGWKKAVTRSQHWENTADRPEET